MTQKLSDILSKAQSLSPDELSELLARLAERNNNQAVARDPDVKWSRARGQARPSLLGEDAQAWVSRTRSESDGRRDPSRGS